MSRKTILILLSILLLGALGWAYLQSKKNISGGDTTSTTGGVFGSLFPFGSGYKSVTKPDTTTSTPGGVTGDTTPSGEKSRFAQISKDSTAGFIVLAAVQKTEPLYPRVRYAASGTGYVYDTDIKGQNVKKASGTIVARTSEAYFGDSGNSVVLRYVKTDNKTIATYLGRVVASIDPSLAGTLTGSFTTDGIADIVPDTTGKSFLYVLPSYAGSSIGTMKFDGSSKKESISSPFKEWLPDSFLSGTTITTKAAATVPGYVYSVGAGGVLTKILGGIPGLTTKMSPDGKTMLYSVSTSSGLALHMYRLKDGIDITTGLSTLPEKCVWNTKSTFAYCGVGTTIVGAAYPDVWYQGSAHFTDALWKLDGKTGTTTQISNGEGKAIDAVHLALDAEEKFLVFINKTDGTLWSFDLAL